MHKIVYLIGLFSVFKHMSGFQDSLLVLSGDPELAGVLDKLDVDDSVKLPSLLDVVAVGADGQAHQVVADGELLGVAGRGLELGGFLEVENKPD